jgi:uncharacterized protein YecE (DUF72 family)
MPRPRPQLGLFAQDEIVPPLPFDEERALARGLPPYLRFGTSSWTYPGWEGIVYPARYKTPELVDQGLALYARNPLLRTVGVDRYFYDAPRQEEIDSIEAQLPEDFPCVVKVWSEITAPVLHGQETPCPTFLDPDFFARRMLVPWGRLLHRTTFLFEFPPMPERHQIPARTFAERLGEFLAALPRGPRYAVELRERRLLTPRYLRALTESGTAHVLNYWGRMPSLLEQLAIPGIFTAPFVVGRLMLPPGGDYEELETRYAPFDRLHRVDEPMRAGVVALAHRCDEEGRELSVLASNKVEGCAPLTLKGIAALLSSR